MAIMVLKFIQLPPSPPLPSTPPPPPRVISLIAPPVDRRMMEIGESERERERGGEEPQCPWNDAPVRRRSIRGVPSPSLMLAAHQTLFRLSSVARIYWGCRQVFFTPYEKVRLGKIFVVLPRKSLMRFATPIYSRILVCVDRCRKGLR